MENKKNDNTTSKKYFVFLMKAVQILAVSLIFTFLLGYFDGKSFSEYGYFYCLIAGFHFIIYSYIGRMYSAFDSMMEKASARIYSQLITVIMTDVIVYAVVCLVLRRVLSVAGIFVSFAASSVFALAWSALTYTLHSSLFPGKNVLIIYSEEKAVSQIRQLYERKKLNIKDTVKISSERDVDAVIKRLNEVDIVLLCGIDTSPRNKILKECLNHNVVAYIRPKIGDLLINGSSKSNLCNLPVFVCGETIQSNLYIIVKRFVDIVLSLLAIIIAGPFMAVTAALIKLNDGGPAIYKQVRLTKGGREFKIYKIRSMRVDAEKDGVARLASEGDDRITPVGKIIRKIRFDELPQLFNILKGDMSFIGPRPERPEIAKQYSKHFPEFNLRLQVKAGLTGYAQVYGKYNTTPYDKLQMDLIYIVNQSLHLDLNILFMTVKIMFMSESTEGVDESQITAIDHQPMDKASGENL